jgi:hypothetical protein
MILGNGDIVWASAEKHRDLFFTAAGSCGSLGVITLLELELIDARSNVELQYIPVNSTQEAVRQLRIYQEDPEVNYMDGIMYSITSGIIMIGRLTDKAIPGKIQRFDRANDPWFYMHDDTCPDLPLPIRQRRILEWTARVQVLRHALQPHHALLAGPFHVLADHGTCPAPIGHCLKNDHPGLRRAVRCCRGVCSMDR